MKVAQFFFKVFGNNWNRQFFDSGIFNEGTQNRWFFEN
jgi:hypothetical protein